MGANKKVADQASSAAMLELLLAQLVAPPVQNSPIRLPGPDAIERRRPTITKPEPVEIEEPSPSPPSPTAPVEPTPPPVDSTLYPLPEVRGLTLYTTPQLDSILRPCLSNSDTNQRLTDCAAALTARLVADGYVNSRVFVVKDPSPGHLDVVEGTLVELRVNSKDSRLQQRVGRLLKPLQGKILHLPTLQKDLQLLRRQAGIGSVRGNLSRLGSDPTQAVFTVSVEPSVRQWQGDVSIRNDGSPGTGEYRGSAALLRSDLALSGDILLLYGEMNWTDDPSLGSLISSISYTLPLTSTLNFTGSFGYTNNSSPEFDSADVDLNSNQIQGLGQFDYLLQETLRQRWSLFAGVSGNRNTINIGISNDDDLSVSQTSSYLRLGINGNGLSGPVAWSGNVYLLQGLSSEFIDAGSARALGTLLSAGWLIAPDWQLNGRLGGQIAFNTLPTSMYFSVGSDIGIRGLPGQLISGENGWVSTLELAWSFWRNNTNTLQLVPFIGAGGVSTDLQQASFNDTVGSGGLLARWLGGNNWSVELGYVHQFETNDNLGVWNDWLLDSGLYAKASYRF